MRFVLMIATALATGASLRTEVNVSLAAAGMRFVLMIATALVTGASLRTEVNVSLAVGRIRTGLLETGNPLASARPISSCLLVGGRVRGGMGSLESELTQSSTRIFRSRVNISRSLGLFMVGSGAVARASK